MYLNYQNTYKNVPTYLENSRFETSVAIKKNETKEALALIKESVGNEKEDEAFYDFIIAIAPTAEAKEIITSIRDDERKHNKILRKIYFELTGVKLPMDTYISEENFNMTYEQALEKALMGELSAVTRYQAVIKGMKSMENHNLILEILTDELRHASKYNYLITKNIRLI
jgi:rubrerythrin